MFGLPRLLPTNTVPGSAFGGDIDNDDNINNGLNPDGQSDISDLIAFLIMFENGDPRGDLANATGHPIPDGGTDVSDLVYMLQQFQGGLSVTAEPVRFGWRAYQWDGRLNLHHVRHRVCDPKLITWLQPDPLGEVDGLNVYAYCGWDPFNKIDPMGLWGGDPFEELGPLGPGQTGRGIAPITRKPGDVEHNIDWTPSELEILHELTGRDNANLKVATVIITTVGDVVISLVPGVGEAQDIVVLADGDQKWYWKIAAGGSLVLAAATFGTAPNISSFLRGSDRLAEVERAFHATHDSSVQSILNGITVVFSDSGNRFGKGFYLAEELGTAIAETAGKGVNRVIKYKVDLAGVKVLDLTDSAAAKKYGYKVGMTHEEAQKVRELAQTDGYEVIRFKAEQGSGNNIVVLTDEAAKKVLSEPVIRRDKPTKCE
jgi:RHS repeat-associated protein